MVFLNFLVLEIIIFCLVRMFGEQDILIKLIFCRNYDKFINFFYLLYKKRKCIELLIRIIRYNGGRGDDSKIFMIFVFWEVQEMYMLYLYIYEYRDREIMYIILFYYYQI